MNPVRLRLGLREGGSMLPSTWRWRNTSPNRHASAHRGSEAQFGSFVRSQGTQTGMMFTLSEACWACIAVDIAAAKPRTTTILRIISSPPITRRNRRSQLINFTDLWLNLKRGLSRSEEHTSELQSLRHLVC